MVFRSKKNIVIDTHSIPQTIPSTVLPNGPHLCLVSRAVVAKHPSVAIALSSQV